MITTPDDCSFSSGGVHMTLTWSATFSPRLNKAYESAQRKFDHEFVRLADKYVPFLTGTLKNSARTATQYGSGQIVYATPYARYQYYLHDMGSDLRDGVRGSYWGQRCIADNKAHFEQFAKKAVEEAL